MPIQFLVESALRPGVPSAKAYQLAFAEIKGQDFDALVVDDPKNSVKISYADLVI